MGKFNVSCNDLDTHTNTLLDMRLNQYNSCTSAYQHCYECHKMAITQYLIVDRIPSFLHLIFRLVRVLRCGGIRDVLQRCFLRWRLASN